MDNRRPSYNTKQRDLILSCLKEHNHNHITADTIVSCLKEQGNPVGQATVYRNLERLVNDGVLLKYDAPDGMCACYQYTEPSENHMNHYHLVCTGCGQMLHLDCDYLNEISIHMREKHRFDFDALKTVLYGRCDRCSTGAQK